MRLGLGDWMARRGVGNRNAMVVQVLVFLVFLVFSMFFSVAPESLLVVSVVFSVSVWGGGKCGLPYSPCCAIAEGHLGCHSIVGGRLPDFCLTAGLRRPPDPMK